MTKRKSHSTAHKNSKSFIFRHLLKSVSDFGKEIWETKDDRGFVVLNLALAILLSFVLTQMLTAVKHKILLPDVIAEILNAVGNGILGVITSAVTTVVLLALFRKKNGTGIKELIGLGSGPVLISLLIVTLAVLSIRPIVTEPCFLIPHVDVFENQKPIVLLAHFDEADSDAKMVKYWPNQLKDISDLVQQAGFEFLQLPGLVDNDDEARTLNQCYGSVVIIWGEVTDKFAEVKYSINRELTSNDEFNASTSITSVDDPSYVDPAKGYLDNSSFTTFVRSGADSEYVLALAAGDIQMMSGYPDKALSYYSNAINKATPARASKLDLSQAHLKRSNALYTQAGSEFKGKEALYQAALQDAQQALIYDSSFPEVYMGKSKVEIALRQYDTAIDDIRAAIKLAPDISYYPVQLAKAQLRAGRPDEGVATLNEVIQKFPYEYSAYYELSEHYNRTGQYDKMLISCSAGIEHGYLDLHRCRGIAHYRLKQYDQAKADFDYAVVSANSTDPSVYNWRGVANYALHKYDDAFNDFTSALELNAQHNQTANVAVSRLNRGNTLFQLEKFDEAVTEYSLSLLSYKDYQLAYKARGYAYRRLGKNELALADLQKYVQLSKDTSSEIQAIIADLQKKLNKP